MSTAELELQTGSASISTTRAPSLDHPLAERVLSIAFGIGLLAADLLAVSGAFMFAFWMRFIAPDERVYAITPQDYAREALAVSVGTCFLFALHGLYDQERPLGWLKQLQAIASSLSTALVIVVTTSYFMGDKEYSRLWFAGGWALAVVGLVIWRTLALRLYIGLRDAIAPGNRVLIVGANAMGEQLARELADGFHVVGYADNGSDLSSPTGAPLLGPISKLEHLVNTYSVDHLVIALPHHRREQVSALLKRGFQRRVKVKLVPELADILPYHAEVEQVGGRAYIGFASNAKVSWTKRAMDFTAVCMGLLALAPVLGIIALLIKLDSPGPVFYRQERVGKNGRRFQMIKFRSMRQDADRLLASLQAHNEASGPLFKMRQDPRVTRVGRVLRRLSLDELPQIINVLKGDMSLVGPRPPLPSEVSKYEEWQLGRLRAVPGMTGLWQVSGRSEVPFHDMVRLDLHYIRNWSFGLDLEILLRTIPAVLASRGAY
jgi:exopolysaccharide biosynthesis polyprenyl glycosylphosphotransferase